MLYIETNWRVSADGDAILVDDSASNDQIGNVAKVGITELKAVVADETCRVTDGRVFPRASRQDEHKAGDEERDDE